MAITIEATYEQGTFKPTKPVALAEGQRVCLSVEPMAMTREQAEAQLAEWHKVYEGLSAEDIAEVEDIALDRSNFCRNRDDDEA